MIDTSPRNFNINLNIINIKIRYQCQYQYQKSIKTISISIPIPQKIEFKLNLKTIPKYLDILQSQANTQKIRASIAHLWTFQAGWSRCVHWVRAPNGFLIIVYNLESVLTSFSRPRPPSPDLHLTSSTALRVKRDPRMYFLIVDTPVEPFGIVLSFRAEVQLSPFMSFKSFIVNKVFLLPKG